MTKCFVCDLDTAGRGEFCFTYHKKYFLCGFHASVVREYIESAAEHEKGKPK